MQSAFPKDPLGPKTYSISIRYTVYHMQLTMHDNELLGLQTENSSKQLLQTNCAKTLLVSSHKTQLIHSLPNTANLAPQAMHLT